MQSFFILLGVLILVIKRYYAGPWSELVNNYTSNIAVSFAVYFIALTGFNLLPRVKWLALIGSLLAMELFELTNGFGLMENVYNP